MFDIFPPTEGKKKSIKKKTKNKNNNKKKKKKMKICSTQREAKTFTKYEEIKFLWRVQIRQCKNPEKKFERTSNQPKNEGERRTKREAIPARKCWRKLLLFFFLSR